MADIAKDIKAGYQHMDSKMRDTLMVMAVATALATGVQNLAQGFMGGMAGVFAQANGVVSALISGTIGGLLGGLILYYAWPHLMTFQKKYLKDYLDSLYKWLFYPAVLGAALGLLSSLVSPWGGAVTGLTNALVQVAIGYGYAKVVSTKLEKYYQ